MVDPVFRRNFDQPDTTTVAATAAEASIAMLEPTGDTDTIAAIDTGLGTEDQLEARRGTAATLRRERRQRLRATRRGALG